MASPVPTVVGRLAPSPTGVLHLGNARTFLLAWLSVRARGGRMLLRVEDIDGPRVRVSATAQALQDLSWLGLDWDGEVVCQTDRLSVYAAACARLLANRQAYACVCSRKEVEEAASAPHEADLDGPVYPGTCASMYTDLADAKARTGRDAAVRFRVETDAVAFVDGFRGAQAGRVCGDFVIQKRDGGPAYQLAVVVDDAAQGVTEVLRGDDLLPSTPRQLLLYRALGLTPPAFTHVPLVVGPDGLRLAKRHGDTSLAWFRARGVRPEQVVGFLAHACGLGPHGGECMPRDLLSRFDLGRLSTEPVDGTRHGLG